MSRCPCPKHPIGCYGHPYKCGCADAEKKSADRIAKLEAAMRQHIAVDPSTLTPRQLRKHLAAMRDAYLAFLDPTPPRPEGE